MPERPTLFDFFRLRFGPAVHLLQSARLAQKNGMSEKIVLAALIRHVPFLIDYAADSAEYIQHERERVNEQVLRLQAATEIARLDREEAAIALHDGASAAG